MTDAGAGVVPRQRGMSISFTNPHDSSANESFTIDDLKSPSPRQASISVSFSTTGTLNYSDDLSLPISPVSLVDEKGGQDESPEGSCDGRSQDTESGKLVKTSTEPTLDITVESNASDECAKEITVEDASSIQFNVDDDQSIVSEEVCACSWKQTSDCNERNSTGQSALSISSSNCFLGGMKLLIEKGADINLRDVYGRSPLHLAVENTESDVHHHCVEYLLEKGANVSIQDEYGRTPLHIAARGGYAKCIKLLLDNGGRTDVKNSAGDTPLHVAAKMGHLQCMEALSPEVGCDESHSSVESVSPSLLFSHDSINNGVAGSFYQSPREMEMYSSIGSFDRSCEVDGAGINEKPRSNDILRETLRLQNDSGYFTARGSAWVKSKYYDNDTIEEERESSIGSSTISDVDGKYEIDSKSDSSSFKSDVSEDATTKSLLYDCLEFVLRVVLYLLHSLLTWTKQSRGSGIRKAKVEPEESRYRFVEPPYHVAAAMERLRQSKLPDQQ